jgi:protein-L-isoaspartate(D-aspartate) O-methyltransferase
MKGSALRRRRFAEELRRRGIAHPLVLDAMAAVPRERFIDEALQAEAYADCSLPIGEKQTISQPWVVARMSEALEPDGGGKVLEIGTGSGYHAAILSRLFEQVYSVERIPSLSRRALAAIRSVGVENVHLKIFDGSYGWGEFAPFRGIVVTAAAPEVPPPLLDQLEDGGRLVIPVSTDGDDDQVLTRWTRRGTEFSREALGPCRFVPLVGRYGRREAAAGPGEGR